MVSASLACEHWVPCINMASAILPPTAPEHRNRHGALPQHPFPSEVHHSFEQEGAYAFFYRVVYSSMVRLKQTNLTISLFVIV